MIETQYHVEIHFEYPSKADAEKIEDDLFGVALNASDVKEFCFDRGGPAHGPYMTCWSRYRIAATLISHDLKTLLRQRGCTITED